VFPPEWSAQCGTFLSWPRPEGISFPGRHHRVPENLARIVVEIARRQDVHINVPNENWQRIVQGQLIEHGVPRAAVLGSGKGGASSRGRRVFFHYIATNECWCRDHGPAFVVDRSVADNAGWHAPTQGLARGNGGGTGGGTGRGGAAGAKCGIVDWKFNAWGGKYPPWDADDAVPTAIAKGLRKVGFKVELFVAPLVMEGGSVEFNGAGTTLTTSQCLLNKNRNPGVPRSAIERGVLDYYGQRHIVWLGEGIEGDDTDGHIDDLARFVGPSTVVIGVEQGAKDPNAKQLDRALKKLFEAKDQSGEGFDIVPVPMPVRVEHAGERLPATYMNFLFVNDACLVPTFAESARGAGARMYARARGRDGEALSALQAAMPGREVVGIDCTELMWGLGAIHCLSQQVPSVPGLGEALRAMATPVVV